MAVLKKKAQSAIRRFAAAPHTGILILAAESLMNEDDGGPAWWGKPSVE